MSPCIVRDVFGGTPHDPTVLAQDTISADDGTGPKIPRSNAYIGLWSDFRLGHSGRSSDLPFAFFHKREPKFGRRTEKSCNIPRVSCSAHFKEIG